MVAKIPKYQNKKTEKSDVKKTAVSWFDLSTCFLLGSSCSHSITYYSRKITCKWQLLYSSASESDCKGVTHALKIDAKGS